MPVLLRVIRRSDEAESCWSLGLRRKRWKKGILNAGQCTESVSDREGVCDKSVLYGDSFESVPLRESL